MSHREKATDAITRLVRDNPEENNLPFLIANDLDVVRANLLSYVAQDGFVAPEIRSGDRTSIMMLLLRAASRSPDSLMELLSGCKKSGFLPQISSLNRRIGFGGDFSDYFFRMMDLANKTELAQSALITVSPQDVGFSVMDVAFSEEKTFSAKAVIGKRSFFRTYPERLVHPDDVARPVMHYLFMHEGGNLLSSDVFRLPGLGVRDELMSPELLSSLNDQAGQNDFFSESYDRNGCAFLSTNADGTSVAVRDGVMTFARRLGGPHDVLHSDVWGISFASEEKLRRAVEDGVRFVISNPKATSVRADSDVKSIKRALRKHAGDVAAVVDEQMTEMFAMGGVSRFSMPAGVLHVYKPNAETPDEAAFERAVNPAVPGSHDDKSVSMLISPSELSIDPKEVIDVGWIGSAESAASVETSSEPEI